MPKLLRRPVLVILIATAVPLGLGGFLARDAIFFNFLYSGTRADWDLMQLRRKFASEQSSESDLSVRKKCFEIARANPGCRVEVASYLFVAKQWPETPDADVARDKLLQAAKKVGIGDLVRSFEESRGLRGFERWRPLVSMLIDRVRRQPDHPEAARLLCEAAVLIRPDANIESAPPELLQIADLILDDYTTSSDLANFCEAVGNLGDPASWSKPFEPHIRGILEVNQNRFVQCSAHFALASIVRSGGIERQVEARQLYENFIERFDGETDYPAKRIEQKNRQAAQQILDTIRLHGLGMPALATAGVDLEGRPMSLAEYRGKVVLLSFWATWCGPCMKAIPHEKKLLQCFSRSEFAIVGVNGDKTPTAALEAVAEHGVTWRSFQNKQEDGSSIANDWHISGWPTFYILDAQGVIARCWTSLPPHSELQMVIKELLKEWNLGSGRE